MKEIFNIQGMSCSACSSSIESALKRKKGIQAISVDLLNHRAIIEFDEEIISLQDIFSFITKLGYTPQKQSVIQKLDSRFLTPKKRILFALIFTCITLYLAMFPMISPSLVPLNPSLNALLQLFCTLIVMHMGRDFYLKGFKTLFSLHPTMDTLVALGSGSAFIYSLVSLITQNNHSLYFESVCMILLFILIGKTIEEKAKQNIQNSLFSLASLKETSVIRIHHQQEQIIPIEKIQIGDILKITPQTTIPTEGILIEGSANLDLSSLNGESLPIHKIQGDHLDSGAFNLNTTFLMQATQIAQNSAYWKILDLVQNALTSKPPIAKFADQISLYFVPCVIVLAIISGGIWLFVKGDIGFALQIFCSILLISCPCALGLATPLALNIASNLASQKGIFFKDARILELIGKTQIVFFDKTGTLTHKELQLHSINSLSFLDSKELLSIAASLEAQSHHIIAQSILLQAKGIQYPKAQNLIIQEGFGISGEIDGKRYKIGNAKSFNPPPKQESEDIIIFIGIEENRQDKILGYLILKEHIRDEAKSCIHYLKHQGISPILLSGDSKHSVQKIAQNLGIDFIASALPQDKLQAIQDASPKITMMIGDGINDMLALSNANISVSIGEGSKGAIASANLIILNNNLNNIPYCINLSRATLTNIKQNLIWAFGYNTLMIPIACGALFGYGISLSPMFASLAMTLSSLSVVFNAQRLKLFKG